MLVDLHIHTNRSDGQYSTEEILKFCEEQNLEIISITDHDTTEPYKDIAKLPNIYTGRIIKGIELSFGLNGRLYDVLGYNIDINIVNNWLNKKHPKSEQLKKQQHILSKMQEIYGRLGFKFDSNIPLSTGLKSEAYTKMIASLISYPENFKLEPDLHHPNFYKKHHTNTTSRYYVDETFNLPTLKEVIDIIHKAGGISILAHSGAYGFDEKELCEFIQIAINNGIDGLELKYPVHTPEHEKTILGFAQKHNLITTGGSDFHGEKIKPQVKLNTTYNNHKLTDKDIQPLLNLIDNK